MKTNSTIILFLVFAWGVYARTGTGQPSTGAAVSAFVGAQACVRCHQQIHNTWLAGRHSKMLQRASAASVKGDFSKSSVTLRGDRYRLRAGNGDYFITTSLTGADQEHRVEYTLGSRRIQHYLTTIDKGRIIVLPPTWDVQRQVWIHNMDIVRPDENHQKPVQQWNKDCVGCHVSQQENNYRPESAEYATKWVDTGTSCERCHGPGRAHVQAYDKPDRPAEGTPSLIVRPTRLDPKTSSMICAQCHSLRNAISPDFAAGRNYYDYFMPRLEYDPTPGNDPPYWADGRPRRFSNDAVGLWQSQCFLRGRATCTSCHNDPHEPDIDKNPQLAARNNTLCTGCHQEIGSRLSAHTRHGVNSTGSSCVDCHMPKTVVSIKATMRDHTIGVPAPENTVAFGIPNACTECHTDKKAAWAVDALGKWWPKGRRTKLVERAEAFTAARSNKPEALDRLVAISADDTMGPLVRANAVGYLRNYADARAGGALLAATRADHPAIRGVAISSLGQRAAQDAPARAAVLGALDDPERAVRISALVALINIGGSPLSAADRERFARVGREFATMDRLYPDDAGYERDLGVVHLLDGELERAAAALQISLGLEPDRPSTRFLLAVTRIGQRRFDEARALLLQVPSTDPYYNGAQERLKTLRK